MRKQVSTVIELPGFVVSIMGVTATWNDVESSSYGNQDDKTMDDNPKKHKNSSLQKRARPDSNHKLLPSQADVLSLRQMHRLTDWILIYN